MVVIMGPNNNEDEPCILQGVLGNVAIMEPPAHPIEEAEAEGRGPMPGTKLPPPLPVGVVVVVTRLDDGPIPCGAVESNELVKPVHPPPLEVEA